VPGFMNILAEAASAARALVEEGIASHHISDVPTALPLSPLVISDSPCERLAQAARLTGVEAVAADIVGEVAGGRGSVTSLIFDDLVVTGDEEIIIEVSLSVSAFLDKDRTASYSKSSTISSTSTCLPGQPKPRHTYLL
jgi:hypothetical protein